MVLVIINVFLWVYVSVSIDFPENILHIYINYFLIFQLLKQPFFQLIAHYLRKVLIDFEFLVNFHFILFITLLQQPNNPIID